MTQGALDQLIEENTHTRLREGPGDWKIIELIDKKLTDEGSIRQTREQIEKYFSNKDHAKGRYAIDFEGVGLIGSNMIVGLERAACNHYHWTGRLLGAINMHYKLEQRLFEIYRMNRESKIIDVYRTISELPIQ